MNYIWHYKEPERNWQEDAGRLARELGMNPAFGKLLLDRGITTAGEARKFFRPSLTDRRWDIRSVSSCMETMTWMG